MKEGKYGEESIRIEIIVIVSDNIQKREKDVNCVKDVEGNQKKIETNLVLKGRHTSLESENMFANLSEKNKYWENVANNT